MAKIKEKLYRENVIKFILIIFPIIELVTSISIDRFDATITLGMVYKLFLLFYTVIYILFIDKKNRKLSYTLFLVLAVVCLANIVVTLESFSPKSLLMKSVEVSKFVAFPIYMLFFIAYSKNGNKIPVKTLVVVATIYCAIMFIAGITGTASPTRGDVIAYGQKGWFHSANELGVLLSILCPITFCMLVKNTSISRILSFALCSYALLSMGTKAALIGIIGTLVAAILFSLFLIIYKRDYMTKKFLIISLISALVVGVLLPSCPSYIYTERSYKTNTETYGDQFAEQMLYTGRQYKLEKQLEIYNNSPLINKLFGIRDADKIINETGDYTLVERDFHDAFFNYGPIGCAIYLGIVLIIILKFIIYILKDFRANCNIGNFLLGAATCLGIFGAHIAGHTLSSPTVSLFAAMLLAMMYCKYSGLKNGSKNKQKVMFICSVGGHLTQMLQLKSIFNDYDYVLITEKTEVTIDLKDKYKMGYLIHGSRQYLFTYFIKEIFNLFKSVIYFMIYNPDTIVTTGTHTAVPMCYIAKFFGKKVIFIESFAKRTSPTKSGKLVYPIADTFIVQWDSLKEVYKQAKVWGWIY